MTGKQEQLVREITWEASDQAVKAVREALLDRGLRAYSVSLWKKIGPAIQEAVAQYVEEEGLGLG